jgi:hypothetical protein
LETSNYLRFHTRHARDMGRDRVNRGGSRGFDRCG